MSVNTVSFGSINAQYLRVQPSKSEAKPSDSAPEASDPKVSTGRPPSSTELEETLGIDLSEDSTETETEEVVVDDADPVTAEPAPHSTPNFRTATSAEVEAERNQKKNNLGFLQRLHLIIEGGYILGGANFGPSVRLDTEPYRSDAAFHRGGVFGGHGSYSLLSHPKFDVRAGIDFKGNVLRSKPENGVPQSGYGSLSFGALGEFNYFPTEAFGLGAQVILGATALLSQGDTDVGAPFPARLSAGEDWGFRWGAGAHLLFGKGGLVRIGGGVEHFATKFNMDVGNGQTARAGTNGPQGHISAGVDIMAIVNYIRN